MEKGVFAMELLTRLSPYEYITEFTRIYREHDGKDISAREADCIQVMSRSLFTPIEPGDLLAGRLSVGEIGFSPEPLLARSVGFYYDEGRIKAIIESGELTNPQCDKLREVLAFWQKEETRRKIRSRFPEDIKEALPEDIYWEHSQIAFPLYRMVGINLDYEKLLKMGLGGLTAELDKRLERATDEKTRQLYHGMKRALETLRAVCHLYAREASAMAAGMEGSRQVELESMAQVLYNVSWEAPKTFVEAMQLAWIYSLIAGALNYGRMDVYLGDFLARDLDSGVLTEEEALAYTQSLWRLIAVRDTVFHGRVIIGGKGRPNETNADRFARLAIEATSTVAEAEPQLSLRFYEGQAPDLMERAIDCLGEGRTYPILYNDEVNIPAVINAFDLKEAEAEDYVMFGCGEYVINHRSFGSPNGILNLLKALEVTLSGGMDVFDPKPLGRDLGTLAECRDFEELYQRYLVQVRRYVEILARQQMLEYRVVAETGSFLYISLLYDDCLDQGRGIFDGGIRYLGGTLETYGNINTANSLYAIKRCIFQEGRIQKADLLPMLEANFQNHEMERKWLLEVDKYGNDREEVDEMAQRLHRDICTMVREQARKVGLHSYLVVIINNEANTILGRFTAASPDGRLQGEPLANANNPYPGSDVEGVTAMLHSLTKLDTRLHAGGVQNMKFSRELFNGHRDILIALLNAYFKNGGQQAMITVLGRQDLENAMREPEKHRHIMVRVGGFSARFVNLSPDVQLEIARRTLY